jgi:hypothetical protein
LIVLESQRSDSASVRLAERLAKAGLTAISLEIAPPWTLEELPAAASAVSEFAADLLEGRHPGLAAPRALGIFAEGREALLAIAIAGCEPRVVSLVTREPEIPESIDESQLAALARSVTARWLELRAEQELPTPIRGKPTQVRRVSNEKEMMEAAVAWLAGMLS